MKPFKQTVPNCQHSETLQTHFVSKLAASCSASSVSSCSSFLFKKLLTSACSSSRRCSGSPSPAVSRARAAERTFRRSESSNVRTPSSQPWGAENSSASCCFRKLSCTLEAAWQLVQSSRMSWELWSFISVGKCRLYSCGTMFFLWGGHRNTQVNHSRSDLVPLHG